MLTIPDRREQLRTPSNAGWIQSDGDAMDAEKKNPKLEFENLVARLEHMILTGIFHPRERLVELNLASALNVSRFWIRDALKILETKGLVTMVPYKGAMVSNLEEDIIEEIFQVRVTLETMAAHLACENMKPADIVALKKIARHITDSFEARNIEAMIAANSSFHDYIFKLARNRTLLQMINQLRVRAHIVRHSAWSSPGAVSQLLQEHEEFVEALQAKDLTKLGRLTKDHVLRIKDFYVLELKTRKAMDSAMTK